MNKAGKPNTLLIELVIVLLFFALSTAVILQVFAAAYQKSEDSALGSFATMAAEDIAERYAASGLDMEAFFEAEGWTGDGARYQCAREAEGRRLLLVAEGGREARPAGALDELTLTVYHGEKALVTLPVARYLPGEGTR